MQRVRFFHRLKNFAELSDLRIGGALDDQLRNQRVERNPALGEGAKFMRVDLAAVISG